MKKLSVILVLAMLLSMTSFGAFAEGDYHQSPMLDAAVEAGELATDATYLAPPQDVQDFYLGVQSLTADTADKAMNETLPELMDYMSENMFLIMPLDGIQKCVVVNNDLGNVPTGGLCIARAFALETLYYTTPQE